MLDCQIVDSQTGPAPWQHHGGEFSAQFKAEALQMVVHNDRPSAQVTKELQINDGTPGNWVKLYR